MPTIESGHGYAQSIALSMCAQEYINGSSISSLVGRWGMRCVQTVMNDPERYAQSKNYDFDSWRWNNGKSTKIAEMNSAELSEAIRMINSNEAFGQEMKIISLEKAYKKLGNNTISTPRQVIKRSIYAKWKTKTK